MKANEERKTVETMRAELLEAFRQEAFPPDNAPPEAMTINQYAVGVGISYDLAKNTLEKLINDEKWIKGTSRRMTAGGRLTLQNVYWPKP